MTDRDRGSTPATAGKVLHWAFGYDLLVSLLMLGGERAYREKLLDLARLASGETVLDVGCGTGTLAIAAKRRIGPAGNVHAIDASPEMIARARKKARKAAVEVVFDTAVAEALPFAPATFDVVLSTVMLHHLPAEACRQCMREIRRVLRPGGRLLAVDFGGPAHARRSLIAHLFDRHVHFDLRDMVPVLNELGLSGVASGAVGFRDLHYVRAAAPSGA